ncbi:MAG TPA: prenyltransferase/squalene oxidase repeat-containing protein [Steroidobacteraceae bacterium]|nr:prenyltransferase/squalene oxidase repeat-containing protein [Steroidobacteraceae bacterium]
MALAGSLESSCVQAVERAAAYIAGRQSPSGGFCFYRYGGVEEPSLGDTYYAVATLRLFGLEVPNARRTMEFVGKARIFGLTYLYFCAFTFDHLGLGARVSEDVCKQIAALTIDLPQASRSIDRSGWLESVRKTIRVQHRFAPQASDRYAHVAQFMRDLFRDGSFGVRRDLWETYLAVSIAALLGLEAMEDTASFVDSLQQPPLGFMMTPSSIVGSLDVAYAGVRCCELLKLPVRRGEEVIEFILACQSTDGGFAHAPQALPNLEFTYRALMTLARLAPQLTRGPLDGGP